MKTEILDLLRQGDFISGQKLGQITGTSRAAVWKHINSLRSEGYRINSVTGKGYCLIDSPDRLLPEEIKSHLQTRVLGHRIIYQHEVSSTQDMARSAAVNGAEEGTLAIAEIQRGGRGRLGRSWASLPGGIFFSLILKPDIKPAEALRIPGDGCSG